jgi:hypothetical protein
MAAQRLAPGTFSQSVVTETAQSNKFKRFFKVTQ